MRDIELANLLFGDDTNVGSYTTSTNSALVPGRTRTYTAVALSDSHNGKVLIQVDGATITNGDGSIEVPTQAFVKKGEVVNITVVNGVPICTGAAGWGDGISDTIIANRIETNTLIATKASIESLDATNANVETLQARTADIETIRANSIKVNNLTAEQLTAATGYIGTLTANSVTAQDIKAATGYIDDLVSENITAESLTADHAVIGDLDANYAQIDLANVNNAWIEDGVIKDAAITSAQIIGVSANKITAGTINGSVINVTNLNADNITAGTLNGQRIGTGSLSLDKLSEDVYTESEIDTIVDNLNDRIDGTIQTWTGDAVPLLSNLPASGWTTDEIKMEHVGDIYYVINSASTSDGFTYRFAYDQSTDSFSWILIKDNQVTDALSRIVDLETFETNTSSWMTTTDGEITSIQSSYTTLSGRVSDNETAISTKVETSAFNTLSNTVSSNSSMITTLSDVIDLQQDGTTSEYYSNAINSIEQTADSNSFRISNLITTLKTESDGSLYSTVDPTSEGYSQSNPSERGWVELVDGVYVASTDTSPVSGKVYYSSEYDTTSIVYRASTLEQDLSGFQTEVTSYQSDMDGTLETLRGSISTIEQSADGLSVQITSVSSSVSDLEDELSNKADADEFNELVSKAITTDTELTTFLTVGRTEDGNHPVLIMGTDRNQIHSELTDTSLAFMNDTNVLAELSGLSGMTVPVLRVSEELHIGAWMFVPRSNGNLTLKYLSV